MIKSLVVTMCWKRIEYPSTFHKACVSDNMVVMEMPWMENSTRGFREQIVAFNLINHYMKKPSIDAISSASVLFVFILIQQCFLYRKRSGRYRRPPLNRWWDECLFLLIQRVSRILKRISLASSKKSGSVIDPE